MDSLDFSVLRGIAFSSLAGVLMASPSGLGAPAATITSGESQAIINWSPPSQSINGVDIEESQDSGATWSTVTKLPPTSTHIRVQNLTDGQNYYFRVRWIWPDNSLGIPSSTLVAVPINIPAAPSGLVATSNETQIALSWDQTTSKSVIGYDIEQSDNGGNTWKVIKPNTGSSSSGYLIDGLTPGTTYSYRIRAIAFGGGESEYSETAVAKIATSTPGGFALNYKVENSKVILNWETPQDIPDVASYDVNASSDGGNNWFKVASEPGGTNSAAVPYVIGGSTYQVIASSAEGQTSASAVELVQTNAITNPLASSPSSTAQQGSTATSTPTTSGGSNTSSGTTNSSGSNSSATGSNGSNSSASTSSGSIPIFPITAGIVGLGAIGGLILWVTRTRSRASRYKRPMARKPVKRKPKKKSKPRKKRAAVKRP